MVNIPNLGQNQTVELLHTSVLSTTDYFHDEDIERYINVKEDFSRKAKTLLILYRMLL